MLNLILLLALCLQSSQGAGFILEMDGNLWAGSTIIKDNPKKQNQNGKLFQDFLTNNPNFTVVNTHPVCEGVFTRVKTTTIGTCKTFLDFFIVCNKISSLVTTMIIDEDGDLTLTKSRGDFIKTDHNMLMMEVDLKCHEDKNHELAEMFNLKDKNCQSIFKVSTSNTDKF